MLSAADRRRRILDAAEALFTAKGYGDTSMDDIARACGMSKKTLYAVFADKASLFSSLIADNDAFPILAYQGSDTIADTRAALTDVLSGLVDFILMPRQVSMTRLAICETLHAPELSQQFFTAALDRGESYLREALTRVFPAWNARTIQPLLPIIVGAALGAATACAGGTRQAARPAHPAAQRCCVRGDGVAAPQPATGGSRLKGVPRSDRMAIREWRSTARA
ncbi:TetR/AcrR family transcriptional regulator [Pigmentiphaga litoralis]|uniref:TetR/AcrR family transcriptional regulator n=1 Tax=Pigmentiphaga litoralis TaxID=516702 RepID=UPI003B430E5C